MRAGLAGATVGAKERIRVARTSHQHNHRDEMILMLIGFAVVITFVADALGWFTTGHFFR